MSKEELVPISINKIIPNREQCRTISDEDIKKIAESIKEIGQIGPIIVRPHNDKFEICIGQDIYEALKYLKKPTVKVIIRNYTEDEGNEVALASLFCKTKISSKEHEIAYHKRWSIGKKNGRYKSITDFARKIGSSQRNVSDLINMKEDREEIFGTEGHSEHISTDTLRRIKTLALPEKKKFCDRIKDGKFKPGDAEEVVKLLKSVSTEIKEEILDGNFHWRDVKTIIEKRQPVVKAIENAIASYHKKEVIGNIIEDEKPHYSPEPFRLLSVFTNTINLKYVNSIEDKNQVEQIKRYLRISSNQIFQLLYELKDIDAKQYSIICNISRISSKIIQRLKDDGHYYFFKHEWLTPKEKKLKEKLDRILNGKDEPLVR